MKCKKKKERQDNEPLVSQKNKLRSYHERAIKKHKHCSFRIACHLCPQKGCFLGNFGHQGLSKR